MLNVAMQDIDQMGDVIYRDAETEKQALKMAKKDYPKCEFAVLEVFDWSADK